MFRIARTVALPLLWAALPATASAQDAAASLNLNVTVTRVDGTTRSGKVLKVERSSDWYAESEWTDNPAKTTVTLEGNGTEVEKKWSEIKTIDIKYGKEDELDCQFDSSYSPIMYMCVLKTVTKVTTTDGKVWDAASRHKWRLHFASGDPEELWLMKIPEREQEESVATLGDGSVQNTELYQKLQDRLMQRVKSTAVTRIDLSGG